MKNRAHHGFLIVALALAIPSTTGMAQTSPPATPAATAPAAGVLKSEELEQLMAPIALYPDTLLASVLMASTYPLEVVEATRWVKENKSLKGEALKAAVDKKGWDDSVKELTATPSVLEMMNGKLDWTQKLGNAVLAQQADVMDAVQRLRARADAQNKLQTTKQQKVSKQTQNNKQVIVIEPAEPNTIYVPYYDPAVVYGAWPYPAYPPYYYPPYAGYYAGAAIATGIAFGVGIAVGAWAANNRFWGGGLGWGNNNININRNANFNNINIGNNTNIGNNNNWRHNPAHRQGVRYNNPEVANRFGKGGDIRNGAQNRMDFRGNDGRQVLNPDRNRPGGDRPGAGNRPGAGDRPGAGNRPNAGDRPNAGNRPNAGDRRDAGNRGQRPNAGQHRSRDNAFSHNQARQARAQSNRGHASMGGRPGGHPNFSGGNFHRGGANFNRGGAAMHRGGGMRGGGRRR